MKRMWITFQKALKDRQGRAGTGSGLARDSCGARLMAAKCAITSAFPHIAFMIPDPGPGDGPRISS